MTDEQLDDGQTDRLLSWIQFADWSDSSYIILQSLLPCWYQVIGNSHNSHLAYLRASCHLLYVISSLTFIYYLYSSWYRTHLIVVFSSSILFYITTFLFISLGQFEHINNKLKVTNNAWCLLKKRLQSTTPCYHLAKKETRFEYFTSFSLQLSSSCSLQESESVSSCMFPVCSCL